MKKSFTIIILAEDRIGLLVRVAGIFSRRRIVIESLAVAPTEAAGICRFTIVIMEAEETARKLVQQIDKQVDIWKTFIYAEDEVVWREQVLYSTKRDSVKEMMKSGLRYVDGFEANAVFEITGTADSIRNVTAALRPYLTSVAKGVRVPLTNEAFLHQELRHLEASTNWVHDVENVII